MHVNQQPRLVEGACTLPDDVIGDILIKVDVETKFACALASSAMRHQLYTLRCWPQVVRLDLHDFRQFQWLQRHITVIEKLSICLEYSLIGRFNCLLPRLGAPHLTSLSIHMAPDQAEDKRPNKTLFWGRLGRGLFFELRALRLVDLQVYHRGLRPVLSTHNLARTLRKLTFDEWQTNNAQVFCPRQSRMVPRVGIAWNFAHLLPAQ